MVLFCVLLDGDGNLLEFVGGENQIRTSGTDAFMQWIVATEASQGIGAPRPNRRLLQNIRCFPRVHRLKVSIPPIGDREGSVE